MINIAILGTGKIIPESVAAIQASKKFNVSLIWARPHSRDKAAALSDRFNVGRISTDLDEVLADPTIDFVYVGLVNSVHHEYAKKALEAGKNVLLEKPFTTNFADAKELADLALSKKLYLFEAVTHIHMPNFYALRDALPSIGKIKMVQCNYSQYSSRYDNYRDNRVVQPAFDPKCYGGALQDINIYNLNFVVALFGEPEKTSYFANLGWNGIDTSGTVFLQYKDFLAQCVGAKDSASPCFLIVQGDNGHIIVKGSPNEFNSVEIAVRGKEIQTLNLNKFPHRMIHEFVEFGETFENKDYKKVEDGLKISLAVMKVTEDAAKFAGIRYA